MDFVKPLEKYEKIFGYEFTPTHDPVEDTYSLSYSAEGVWGDFCTEICFEDLTLKEAELYVKGMVEAFDIAIKAQMGVPVRLAQTYTKSYLEDMQMREMELEATPKGEDCNSYMIKKKFDKMYNK